MVKDNGIQMKGQPYKFKTDKDDNHIRITFNRIPTIVKIIKISNNKITKISNNKMETAVMDTNNKIINGENIMAGAVVVGEDIIINKIIMKSKKVIL